MRPALLALEDGRCFEGIAFGADGTTTGELCFNTGMTGYQEVLTDPSYKGQIVTMTATQIGNTGTNDHDDQSLRPQVAGFVMRSAAETTSSWRAERSLQDYLVDNDVVAIAEIDTRAVTRHIREAGAMRAAVSSVIVDRDELVDVARSSPSYVGRDLVTEVTTPVSYTWGPEELDVRTLSGYAAGRESAVTSPRPATAQRNRRIAAYDYGIKRNILDLLVASGCEVTVLPATTPAEEILSGGFEGVFLANGPGDPEPLGYAIESVRRLIGRVPIFGICLGHQVLALALGARTYKLPFGHRGSNHPVRRVGHERIEITCQNHGFAVDGSSLPDGVALTHVNLNDDTVEGLSVSGVAFSVQYHPESGPGPHDSRYLFEAFHRSMGSFEPTELEVSI